MILDRRQDPIDPSSSQAISSPLNTGPVFDSSITTKPGAPIPDPTNGSNGIIGLADPFALSSSPILVVTVVVIVVVVLFVVLSVLCLCRGRHLRRASQRHAEALMVRSRNPSRRKRKRLGPKPVMTTVWIEDLRSESKGEWKSILPLSTSFPPLINVETPAIMNVTTPPALTNPSNMVQVSVLIAMPSYEKSQLQTTQTSEHPSETYYTLPLPPIQQSQTETFIKDPDAESEWEAETSIPELVLGVVGMDVGWTAATVDTDGIIGPTLTVPEPR